MSLLKSRCENCWLPPLEHKPRCRKCDTKCSFVSHVKHKVSLEKNEPAKQIAWIRNHVTSPDHCRAFRKFITSKLYYGNAIPEECQHCCAFLFSLNPEEYPTERAALLLCLLVTPIEVVAHRFGEWIHENRDAFLSYFSELLSYYSERDERLCGKLVNALLQSVGTSKRLWILEELAQRPSSYGLFLQKKGYIPDYCSYSFWQTDEESWWSFWEKMVPSTQRRIRFRCLRFKEELMQKTWHPDRFIQWCISEQERKEMDGRWSNFLED